MVTMSLTLISTVVFYLIDFTAEDWLTSVLASIVQFPCSIWALVEALKLKYKGYVIEMVEQWGQARAVLLCINSVKPAFW